MPATLNYYPILSGVGAPRLSTTYLTDADITIAPNTDVCAMYVLPAGTLTANRTLTVDNTAGDQSKGLWIVVLDTSAFTYDMRNSTPTLVYQKTANRPAATYQFFYNAGVWGSNTHYWTQG